MRRGIIRRLEEILLLRKELEERVLEGYRELG